MGLCALMKGSALVCRSTAREALADLASHEEDFPLFMGLMHGLINAELTFEATYAPPVICEMTRAVSL